MIQSKHRTPVIEDAKVTFVWRGKTAPQLIGDFCDWEESPVVMTQSDPGVWTHTLTFPQDAYIEYSFWQEKERVADPLNPCTTPDGLGHRNHYFYMPDAQPTPLTKRKRSVRKGRLTRHLLEDDFLLAGGKRIAYLYQPAVAEPCPLLVVFDGQDYRTRAKLTNIVDNLVSEKRMQPVALAMIHHGNKARALEYACNDIHLAAVFHLLLPLARQELNLVDVESSPGAYGILGASMGGLMAVYVGLRAPHVFGKVLCQSGAFDIADWEMIVGEMIRHHPKKEVRLWMDVGRFEWLLGPNRRTSKLLRDRGYDVSYREHNGGHNYPSWRNDLEHGLAFSFPPIN
jgi:enterochelin esterase family protein